MASLTYFFRDSVFSHFQLLNGDNGDTRIQIAILEHWSAVFTGHAAMRSPNFFWPVQGVLGYSDGMVLFWPSYAVARAVGCDLFLSFQITLIFFKLVGFVSMFWLLKSCFRTRVAAAALGAVLFTVSSMYSVPIGSSHNQLVIVNWIPLLAVLAYKTWETAAANSKRKAYLNAGAFGVLLAMLFFSSFYIAWFALFAGGLALVVAFAIRCVQMRSLLSTFREWTKELLRRKPSIAIAGLFFAVAILPFLVTYLPVLKETGGRRFDEGLTYSARPIDILNVGRKNRIWGRPLDKLFVRVGNTPMVGNETQSGWPPLILLTCLVAIVLSLRPGRKKFLVASVGLAFVVGVLLSLKFGNFSLWWIVFQWVPGGSAIRVPARFNHVTNILLLLAVCLAMDQCWRRSRALFWALAVVLVAEQLNREHIGRLRRDLENTILARAVQPPSDCRFFFLTKPAANDRLWYVNQLDAMLVARRFNLPTINGYSGWQPPGWHLEEINGAYFSQVRQWTTAHKMIHGACGLDLSSGKWSAVDLTATPYAIGSIIDFHKNGNAASYELEGWSGEEDTGSWTRGGKSALELGLSQVPRTDVVLLIRAHAFINRLHPHFKESVIVNGKEVAEWNIVAVPVQKTLLLPRSAITAPRLRIEFINHNPKSPAELGMWGDTRKLGLGLESIEIAYQR